MAVAADSSSDVRSRLKNRRGGWPAVVVAVTAVMTLLAGCSSDGAEGGTSSRGMPLQLRLVMSSVAGSCTSPDLISDPAASACDREGTTTYELSEVLGVITPESVTLSAVQESAPSVTLSLSDADIVTLGEVSREALNKNLAIILDGRVMSAPMVMDTLTTSPLTLAFATDSEANQAAADLRAPEIP